MSSTKTETLSATNGDAKGNKTLSDRGHRRYYNSKKQTAKAASTGNGEAQATDVEPLGMKIVKGKTTADESKKPYNRMATKKKVLTPRQLQELKTGPKVDVFVGHIDEQFLGIEGAYKKVLVHFSGRAQKFLAPDGETRLHLPNTRKETIDWIYEYMLAGGKDPDESDKFEDFNLSRLLLVYAHAETMEYDFLVQKAGKRIKLCVNDMGVLDVETMTSIITFLPSLRQTIADLLAYEICEWVVAFDWAHIHAVYAVGGMAELIDAAVEKNLKAWTARSHWYYNRPSTKRYLDSISHHYGGASAHSRPHKSQGQEKLPSTSEVKADTQPKKEQKPKTVRHKKKGKAMQTDKAPGGETHGERSGDKAEPTTDSQAAPASRQARKSPESPTQFTVEPKVSGIAYSELEVEPKELQKRQAKPKNQRSKRRSKVDVSGDTSVGKDHLPSDHPGQHLKDEQEHSKKPSREPPVCYNCNDVGHIARECTRPPRVREPPTCYRCREVGHVARECSRVHSERALQPKLCHKCQESGHIARNCNGPVRERTSSPPTCFACNELGHLSRDCSHEPPICYRCQELGHIARDCNGPVRERTSSPPTCFACNEVGHLSRDCSREPPICYRCQELGHIARDCNGPVRERVRPPPTCFTCNEVGHVSRECSHGRLESTRQQPTCYNCKQVGHIARDCEELDGGRGAEYGIAPNEYGEGHTYNASNGRASAYVGQGRTRRRANAERYTDRYYEEPIEVNGNGETLNTCDREDNKE